MRAAMLSQARLGARGPGLAALAALLLLDGALTLGAGAEAQRRRPPSSTVDERRGAPTGRRRTSGAEAPAARAIIPVLTEREKRCRLANECAMVGPCPACPR